MPSGIAKSRLAGNGARVRDESAMEPSSREPTAGAALHAATLPNPAKTSRRVMVIGVPPREKNPRAAVRGAAKPPISVFWRRAYHDVVCGVTPSPFRHSGDSRRAKAVGSTHAPLER